MIIRSLCYTLFPYTTLFRSGRGVQATLDRFQGALVGHREVADFVDLVTEQVHAHPVGGKTSRIDRKSTRLNSSHVANSYAVFCLKKTKKKKVNHITSRTIQR